MHQDSDETVDAYLTRLKLKIDHCEYNKTGWPPAVKTELTRDKFVFGLLDDSLKERLLRESDLTLARAVSIAQRSESSKQHVKEMSTAKQSANCDEVQHRLPPPGVSGRGRVSVCGHCGRPHKPRECPAYGQQCSICHKFNHFAKVCRSKHLLSQAAQQSRSRTKKRVHVVDDLDSESDTESLSLDPIQIDGLAEQSWFSTISTSGGDVTFKLDTGAEASVIPTRVYKNMSSKPVLKPTNVHLTAYGSASITPHGTCTLMCKGKLQSHSIKFYVVSVDASPILGLSACQKLGLIQRVDAINTLHGLTKATIKERYPTVFAGLGKLGKYHITTQEGCEPVVNPSRRVPHSLKDKLKQTLEKNIESGVLVKVDELTDWVHNLVIVEKKNGSLRLCLDPRELNRVVKREHYRIPTVQEISSELAGKKVFSTVDLKDGYWQVELDEASSYLCTFNTPFGRYRFTRMPFGLKSASEVF